jgi:hypothetical protein
MTFGHEQKELDSDCDPDADTGKPTAIESRGSSILALEPLGSKTTGNATQGPKGRRRIATDTDRNQSARYTSIYYEA